MYFWNYHPPPALAFVIEKGENKKSIYQFLGANISDTQFRRVASALSFGQKLEVCVSWFVPKLFFPRSAACVFIYYYLF